MAWPTAQTNVTWTVNSAGLSLNASGYAGTGTSITGNAAITLNSNGLQFNGASLAGTSTGFTGANISASLTHNSAGLALSMSVAAPGGGGGVALSAGTQSVSTGTMVFANSNGVTFGMSGSSQITASHNGLTTQTNPGASASNGSFSFQTLNFSNANNVTFGTSAGGIITASVAAPGAAAENNWMALLGANTAGNTTASGSTIGLSGLNLTLSGTNASQIVISAPATSSLVGASGIQISTNGSTISVLPGFGSYFGWPLVKMINTQTQAVQSNTSAVFYIEPKGLEAFSFIMMPQTVSIASMASIATAANNTKS